MRRLQNLTSQVLIKYQHVNKNQLPLVSGSLYLLWHFFLLDLSSRL
jgi:hypothetical protein